MLIAEIARTSEAVAGTSGRKAKVTALAGCLRRADAGEAATVVAYLSGELPQRQIGVGYAALRDLPPPAAEPSLTVPEVDASFTEIGAVSGPGSVARRRDLVAALFARATRAEQNFLVRLLAGELRQGALDGVMAEAIAAAAEVPSAEVRRAFMLRGSLGPVATAALADGVAALRAFTLEVGRPVKPMLAASAPSTDEAFAKLKAEAAVEWKLDGIRAQIHIADGEVHIFTRTLDEITTRLPEVVEAVKALPVHKAVFDGELIALRPDGTPHPFQVTAARTATRTTKTTDQVPLSIYIFDVLYLEETPTPTEPAPSTPGSTSSTGEVADGAADDVGGESVAGGDLLDAPGVERNAALARVVPEGLRMPRVVTGDPVRAKEVFDEAVARGHEGVVVKSLGTPYTAGRRGAGWIKVKPRHTLDLVVLAVEWGHGRRQGLLSNLHLGARDPETGGFVMLGKTFKGLTDELLAWQTKKLRELAVREDDWVVHVRPELVVEIAFDGVQHSPRYPGGIALRFARVLRYRPDKSAGEADTIETVRAVAPVMD
ncbi:ATP-dependent DNA ligase [Actinomadura sp. NAK00032]|uniref:ATP-dependent DNA ligase n=1 Tax=Actinomadura sp. NAK00032 TaxID=2742128 RepID=UPI0015912653|nr:ATP-dependent DNA ligase [Actinomadura sp. NAK00032]QKW38646.1 ATP-dependent DNA ligase [Actinomadura sp. NAK00032]